jgi:hypothetical protein
MSYGSNTPVASRVRDIIAVTLLLVVVWALHGALLPWRGGPTVHLVFDSYDFSYPFVVFMNRCLRAGVWPAWNPFEFVGTQFWGNLQSLLFNPPTLIAATFSDVTVAGFQALQVAQVALGGLGMFVWTRARTDSAFAGLVVGILFVGGGGVVNLFSHHALLALYCLLPWPFALFRLWLKQRRMRYLALTAFAIASWLVTSYPSQLGYYCVAFVAYYAMVRAPALRRRDERPALAREWLFLGVIAPALASIHLVPAIAWLQQLSRGHGIPLDVIRSRLGHPPQLFSIVFGGLATAGEWSAMPDPSLRDYAVGLVAMFAALYAVARPTWRRLVALAAVAACCDLMMEHSLLLPLVHRISRLTANSLYPAVEFGTLVCFILLTLAGDGLAEMMNGPWSSRRTAIAAGGCAVVLAAFFAYALPQYPRFRADAVAWSTRIARPLETAAALIAAALAARRFLGEPGRLAACLLLLVVAANDAHVNVATNSVVMYYPGFGAEPALTPPASYVDLKTRIARRGTFPAVSHQNLVAGWRADGGFDASTTRLTTWALATPAVRTVLLDPRPAFVADEATTVADPGTVALFAGQRIVAALPTGTVIEARSSPETKVDVVRYSINDAGYSVVSPAPVLVVFNELALPGWTVLVDGNPHPLLTANGCFRAVAVPAGSHAVSFRFTPPGARLGVLITATGLLLAFAFLAASRRNRPRPR